MVCACWRRAVALASSRWHGAGSLTYSLENARSLIAVALIILIAWLFSEQKRRFPFLLMVGALALQAGLVLALFAVPNSQGVLAGVTSAVDGLADAADRGAQFVFGYLSGGDQPYGAVAENAPFIFGFRVLPLILVISALSALLWHWGHIALADVGVRFRF